MIIDLTYACSMGCTHCMSSCKPDGEHMTMQTLKDTLEFADKHSIKSIILSGGEIYENPQIEEMLDYIADYCISKNIPMSITTNGRILSSDTNKLEHLRKIKEKLGKKRFVLQVTDDERFYPTKLDDKSRYRLEKLGAIVEGVPHKEGEYQKCLYPQGRALENFDESYWYTNCPKCANATIIAKQMKIKNGKLTIKELCDTLFYAGKLCSPCIAPDGSIKLGESQHCPSIASIYDDPEEIIDKIVNHKCRKCEIPFEIMKKNRPLEWAVYSMI